jgi:Ca2+-binding RTX toxin-like protein
MPQSNVTSWLQFAIQQMAAESYQDGFAFSNTNELIRRLQFGNNNQPVLGIDPNPDLSPNLQGATRFAQIQAVEFTQRYDIVSHHANDATGFSATLIKDLSDPTGKTFTLSFRSLEYQNQVDGGDWQRDGLPGAAGEIALDGFALAQLVSMERYYLALKADPTKLPAGAILNVTGYSLGGHLATVFTQLHANDVTATYTFNGAGRGGINGGTLGLSETERIREMLQFAEARLEAIDPTWFANGNTENVYGDSRYRQAYLETIVAFKPTGSFLPPGAVSTAPGFDKITQLVGQATHNDQPYVANSGIHATPTTIFIEDQPNVDGLGGLFGQSGSFGTTHSITLLVDSLAVMELFQKVDGALEQAAIEGIFAAASSQTGSGVVGLAGLAEGNSLENALDVLGKILVPNYTPTPFGRQTNDFGNLTFRNPFYTNINQVKSLVATGLFSIDSLVAMSSSSISSQARSNTADGMAYRYALQELNPFAVRGVDYGALHNEGPAESRPLDLYDTQTGNGTWTALALSDRAELLAKRLAYNLSDGGAVPTDTHYLDLQSGFEVGSISSTNEVIFGDDRVGDVIIGHSGDDHLYGRDGADTIEGHGGRDYIEGGVGNDPRLSGGAGDDIILGQQGDDQLYGETDNDRLNGGLGDDLLDGGTGLDTYFYRTGHGLDRIVDADKIGTIQFDNQILQGGLHRTSDSANTYVSPNGQFTYVKSGANLVINNTLTIENFDFVSGALGIKLAEAPNTTLPTVPTIDFGANGFPSLTVNAPSDGAGYTIERFGAVNYTLNGNVGTDVLVSDLGRDQMYGFGNADQLFGRSGNDLLDGGLGNDQLNGGVGDDLLYGGAGDDVVNGADEVGDEAGADYLEGGDGLDILLGGAGDDVLVGGVGDDQLSGEGLLVNGLLSSSTGHDYLDGGDGNDGLTGFAGDDILLGGAGNDLLSGDNLKNSTQAWDSAVDGEDYLDGGAGDDELNGGGKDDILIGGIGNDVLYGEGIGYAALAGHDWLEGGDGTDQLYGGLGADALFGGAGVDLLVGDFVNESGADDTLDGGAGNDELRGGGGHDLLDGGSEQDLLFGEAGDDSLYGGLGDDQLAGGEGDDVLAGDAGIDQLFGDAGADELSGGLGDDLLSGGADDDTLFGDEGHDELQGGLGADLLVGGEGNDRLFGQEGADELIGDSGSDVLVGGAEADQLFGGGEGDLLQGEDGNDVLYGEQGNDQLAGGTGDDTLVGGDGDDVLIADAGDDVIEGGTGNDVLIGGEGRDTYVYAAGDGADSIGDVVDAGGISNTIRFGTGIASNQLTVAMSDGVLFLRIGTAGDTIALGGVDPNAVSSFRDFDTFQLADNSTVTFTQLVDRGIALTGTAGNNVLIGTNVADRISGLDGDDTLLGRAGDDVLDGGAGNDFLDGEAGSDTYLFGHGSGRDNLTESDFTTVNTIQLSADVSPGELAVRRGGPHLFLDLDSTNARVTISDFFLDAAHQNFQARFADGTLWDAARLIFESRIVRGTDGPDNLAGANNSDDIVLGFGGDDLLSGLSGDDILEGGRGDDQLNGGVGHDTYRFNQGDGQDTIRDTLTGSQTNTVVFGPGITPNSISLGGAIENDFLGSSLLIRVGTGGDALIVGNFNPLDAATPQTISHYQFSDGTLLTHSQLMARGFDLVGTDEDDLLIGTNLSDRFTGGAGSDVLKGGEGDDTYLFGHGAGQDHVSEFTGSLDAVRMAADILPSDVTVTRNGRDLVFSLNGTQDRLTVTGWFLAQPLQIEQVQFADGTIWDVPFLQNLTQSIIRGIDGADVLTGTPEADRLEGLGGNDQLTGLAGHDLLDGGTGADALSGGSGDDLYVVDDTGDVVAELANEGTDTVLTAISYQLSAHVENLTLTGPSTGSGQAAAIDGIGNALDNVLTGNSAANIFTGGAGNDTYVVGAGDTVVELPGEGTDTVQSTITYTLGANVENLTLTGNAAINGTGNSADNVLVGNASVNMLAGGAGNDTYVVGLGDRVIEFIGEGSDTVESAESYTLGANLENLTLLDTTATHVLRLQFEQQGGAGFSLSHGTATGNELDNVLIGNAGSNVLDGQAGADTMAGGQGGDLYHVDNSGDIVLEGSSAGRDTVESTWSYTLSAHLENLTLTGSSPINGTGNELDNMLTGNDAANILDGGAGNDRLQGGAGADTYRFGHGYGLDQIYDGGPDQNVIQMTPDVAPNQVIVRQYISPGFGVISGLVLEMSGGADKLFVPGFFDFPGPQRVEFADGTMWDRQTLITLAGVNSADTTNWNAVLQRDEPRSPILGTDVEDMLQGTAGNDDLRGLAGDDTIFGLGGDDRLSGREGADLLIGGPGDDIYEFVDDLDSVIESQGEGIDALIVPFSTTTASYVLPANVENLLGFVSFAGSGGNSVQGNDLDNLIIGTEADDLLDGGAGNDTIGGGFFRQLEGPPYYLGSGSDILIGGLGNDALVALGTNFDPNGRPHAGDDVLIGGLGDDTYGLDHSGHVVVELAGEGSDTVTTYVNYTLGEHVENLTFVNGTGSALTGTGNALDNVMLGNADDNVLNGLDGNDTLAGGEYGNDTLRGGAGHDTYLFNMSSGIETVGGGHDTIEDTATAGEGNRIQFGTGIAQNDLTFTRDEVARTLTIQVGSSGIDQLFLTNFDPTGANGSLVVETLAFADGSTANLADLLGLSVNHAPTVTTPLADQTVPEDAPFSLVVPANTFADEDASDVFMLSASLADGTALPAWLNFNAATATFSGTPDDAQVGTLDLRVTATDTGNLAVSDEFTLVVTNVNEPPAVAAPLADRQATEDTVFSFVVPASTFADVDAGDALTYSATLVGGAPLSSWLSFDAATRTFSGTPLNGDVGTLTIAVKATDSGSLNATDTFALSIQNVNDAPTVAAPIADQTAAEDSAFTLTLPGTTFADEDAIHADVLTYDATLANGSPLPTWLSFNPTTRTFSGTPGVGDSGTLQIAVAATDSGNLSVSDQFALVISGPLPITIVGTAGNDILTGGRGDDTLTGLAGNDTLTGGEGHDLLDGGTGTDTIAGGTGNDTYIVDVSGDVVTELTNEGTDTVQSAITYTLGANVENLTLTGAANLNGTGNALDNILAGNSGINVLTGGAGNDTYIVGAGDTVVEQAGGGIDTVQSAVAWTLSLNVENLTLTGTANINGTGSSGNNVLTGNSGNNTLDSGSGNDTVDGGAGNDSLLGGSGNDQLLGGVGDDTLNAGSGNDVLNGGDGIDTLDGGSGDDQLLGGAGNDTLTGGSGADQFTGGTGNDTMTGGSGNDLYTFLRGDGQDTIIDSDPFPGNQDRALFGATINPLDLVISRQANDLRLSIHGSPDQITVQNWYLSTNNRIETVQAGNGQTLLSTQVDQLIQAMAGFTQQTGLSWDQGIDQQPAQVQSILAASWQ